MAPGRQPPAAARSREIGVHVDEHRPGNVTRPPGIAAPAGGIEVPAHVGHDEAGLDEPGGEPGGVDERLHRPYFIFVTGCATFL